MAGADPPLCAWESLVYPRRSESEPPNLSELRATISKAQHAEENPGEEILDCQAENPIEQVPQVTKQTPIQKAPHGDIQDCVPEDSSSPFCGKENVSRIAAS